MRVAGVMSSSLTTWNTGLMPKFERSYEMRDWQTSSLHMRHHCLRFQWLFLERNLSAPKLLSKRVLDEVGQVD